MHSFKNTNTAIQSVYSTLTNTIIMFGGFLCLFFCVLFVCASLFYIFDLFIYLIIQFNVHVLWLLLQHMHPQRITYWSYPCTLSSDVKYMYNI